MKYSCNPINIEYKYQFICSATKFLRNTDKINDKK